MITNLHSLVNFWYEYISEKSRESKYKMVLCRKLMGITAASLAKDITGSQGAFLVEQSFRSRQFR
jgi:hypothetical protein